MANVLHSAAGGIHPGAHFAGSAPTPAQDHVLWVDTSTGPPYALKVWNAGASAWQAVGTGGSAGTITTAHAQLGADVSMAAANTPVDIMNFTLGAGTWVVWYTGTYKGLSQSFSCKLWDGTTVYASQEATQGLALTFPIGVAIVTPPFTLGGSTTVKVTAESQGAGGVAIAAMQHFGAGNNAHTLLGMQVA